MSMEQDNLNPTPQQADTPEQTTPPEQTGASGESPGGVAVETQPVAEAAPQPETPAVTPATEPPAQEQPPVQQYDAPQPVEGQQAPFAQGSQPGQQQVPPQAPGDQQPAPPPPPKKGKKSLIAAIVALCLVLVAVVGVFAFNRSGIGKSDGADGIVVDPNMAPEEYVVAALEKTTEEVVLATSFLPDFQKFIGRPTSHEFNLKLNLLEMLGPYAPVSEATVNGLLMLDGESQKMLAELSVLAGSMGNYENNQLYISPEVIAVSIPSVFTKARYLTMNPDTMMEDYAGSIFYDPTTDLSGLEGLDFFKMARSSTEMQETMARLFEDFQNSAQVDDDKPRDRMAPRTMTFTYSAASVEQFYNDILDTYKDYMANLLLMTDYSYYSYYGNVEEDAEELLEEMRKLRFPDDMVIRYVVTSSGIVEDIRMERFRIGYEGEDTFLTVSARGDMYSEPGVSSGMDLSITLTSPYDDRIDLRVTRDSRNEGGEITDKIVLTMREDGEYGDDITLSYSLDWTPEMTGGGSNMKVKLRMEDGYDDVGVEITGDLSETEDSLSLQNATLTLMEDNYDLINLNFDYTVRVVDSADISVDLSDSVSVFALTMEDLYSMMGAAMSVMS